MSESSHRTIISITTLRLAVALAATAVTACSNPTPDAFNRPITPKSDSTDGTAKGSDDPASDSSGDGDSTSGCNSCHSSTNPITL